MRSLSTKALGQPSETIPMVGWPWRGAFGSCALARSGRRLGGLLDIFTPNIWEASTGLQSRWPSFFKLAPPVAACAHGLKGNAHMGFAIGFAGLGRQTAEPKFIGRRIANGPFTSALGQFQ